MQKHTEKYYITTAIAYASGKPHIGNTYEAILADAIARFKKQQGHDVFFMTGTDEHGQKIQLKAEAAGVTPQEYVDNVAGVIKGIWDKMNVKYEKVYADDDAEFAEKYQIMTVPTLIVGGKEKIVGYGPIRKYLMSVKAAD